MIDRQIPSGVRFGTARLRSRTVATVQLAMAISLAGAAMARADTYCVNTGGCGAQQTFTQVQPALDAARARSGPDEVRIGPGLYTGRFTYASDDPVSITGAGQGATTLGRTVGEGNSTIDLTAPGSSIRDMTVVAPPGGIGLTTGSGLYTSRAPVTAERLTMRPADGATGGGIYGGPLTLRSSAVTARGSSQGSSAVTLLDPGTIEDSSIEGDDGVKAYSDSVIRRSRITTAQFGVLASGGTVRVASTIVRSRPAAGDSRGLAASDHNGDTTLQLFNVTAVGSEPGDARASGISSEAVSGHTANVEMTNTVVHGYGTSIARLALGSSTARMTTITSSYDRSTMRENDGFGGPISESNALGPPSGFVGPDDFRLRFDSPLVDAGTAVFHFEPAVDPDGKPRLVDGNGDGNAVLDVGAFEYQRSRPVAAASGPPSAQVGQAISFSGEGSADPDPGEGLTYAWRFDDGATASGSRVTHAFSTPGRHTATLTVGDPTGQNASATVTVMVVDARAPVIRSASITRAFRVGRANTPLVGNTAVATGATIRYRLSEAATVRIAIHRALAGRRVGRRCLAPTRARRRAPRCTRYSTVATLTRTSRAGDNRVPFTGRIRGRALVPGAYRAVLTATDAAGNLSRPRALQFQIVRPAPRRGR